MAKDRTEKMMENALNSLEEKMHAILSHAYRNAEQRDLLRKKITAEFSQVKNTCMPLLSSDHAFAKTLDENRRVIADEFIESWNFPLPVEATSGWTMIGDTWEMSVFLDEGRETSRKETVTLSFLPASSDLDEVKAPEDDIESLIMALTPV